MGAGAAGRRPRNDLSPQGVGGRMWELALWDVERGMRRWGVGCEMQEVGCGIWDVGDRM